MPAAWRLCLRLPALCAAIVSVGAVEDDMEKEEATERRLQAERVGRVMGDTRHKQLQSLRGGRETIVLTAAGSASQRPLSHLNPTSSLHPHPHPTLLVRKRPQYTRDVDNNAGRLSPPQELIRLRLQPQPPTPPAARARSHNGLQHGSPHRRSRR